METQKQRNSSDRIVKTYKFQQIGSSYYIAIPKPFVSQQMLIKGVHIKLIEYDENHLTIKIIAAPPTKAESKNKGGAQKNGEHPKNNKTSRKNTS